MDLKFNPATPLYTSDARAWRIQDLPGLLDDLNATGKPIVFFIHGRGKEPGKSLQGGTFTKGMAVHKLERGYDVRVLMFNWDSAFHGFNFLDREVPLSHTQAAGESLGVVLAALMQYRTTSPAASRLAMLTHSMGSIVVKQAIENGHWPDAGGLFSNVVFSEPDADDVGHSAWLESLARREQVYVTQNRDDNVLKRSTDARPADAQALGLGTLQPLALHAKYVDLTNMGPIGKKDEDHEVFGKNAMNGQLYVCNFFTQGLTGQPVLLDPAVNVESVDRQVVYRLRNRYEPGAPCLKTPKLP